MFSRNLDRPDHDVLDGPHLQIVLEQVRRARAMAPSQRLAEAFSLTDAVFGKMHVGALQRLATADRQEPSP